MDIIKVILGILVVVAAFTIPSLILAIRYLKGKGEKDKKEKKTIDKADEMGLKEIWWGYFKPLAAIPVAWYSYHLIFYLMSPGIARAIWDIHWYYLMVIELVVIALNSIINKKTPFEKRISRKLMVVTYVQTFIIAGIMIIFRIGWSETAANLNRATLSMLVNSKTELQVEDTEKLTKAYRVKPALEKMDEIHKKAKKLDQLDEKEKKKFFSELEKMESWKAEAQKEYAVPDEKKIDWQKLWPFGKTAEAQAEQPRRLSGIFKLPADGKIIDRDVNGRKLPYRKGEQIQLQQLNLPPEKLTFVNHNIPSWTRRQRIYTSDPATEDGKVELMSPEGKAIAVQVRIIPRS